MKKPACESEILCSTINGDSSVLEDGVDRILADVVEEAVEVGSVEDSEVGLAGCCKSRY